MTQVSSSIEARGAASRSLGIDPENDGDEDEIAPPSILLVEDEGIVAHDLEETLTRLGYRVSGIASEGAQAVRMAQELQPELVVMDVSLRGEIDGIQAARLIQERSRVPVIFLTGNYQRAGSEGRELATDILIKPVSEKAILRAVAAALHLDQG